MAPLRLSKPTAVFFHLSSADSPSHSERLTGRTQHDPRYDPAQDCAPDSSLQRASPKARMWPRYRESWEVGAPEAAPLSRDKAEQSREVLCSVEVVGVTCVLTAPSPACPRPARPSHAFRPRPACGRRSPPQLQHLGPGRPCEGQPAGGGSPA